jgi:hypothetical protein
MLSSEKTVLYRPKGQRDARWPHYNFKFQRRNTGDNGEVSGLSFGGKGAEPCCLHLAPPVRLRKEPSGGSGHHGQMVHCDFRITCKIVQTLVPTQWLRREGRNTGVEVDVDAAMEISRLVGRRCRGVSLAGAGGFFSPWTPERKNWSSFHRHFNLLLKKLTARPFFCY